MANRREKITNILKGLNPLDPKVRQDFGEGFKSDYGIGREDTTKMYYRERDLKGMPEEATRAASMFGTHPGIFRVQELTGKISKDKKQALREADMDLRGTIAHKGGQLVGSALNDVTQDRSRGVYWLLNALQATGEVINESVLAKAVPELYRRTTVNHPTLMRKVPGGKEPMPLSFNDAKHRELMLRQGMAKDIDGKVRPARGYSMNSQNELQKRNYEPGMIQALAIPTGIAINSGLGLLTPFGGAEGYKAAAPDPEDPTKSANIPLEVGLKYVMGRTGQLLPYSEFSKVRPDVSREEYNKYQAFKYDKSEDYNPLDGDLSFGGGAIRATSEGIHGPEVQFLGRSLPVTTGIIPYTTALAGGVVGARIGARNKKAASRGLIGGMTGLVAGQVGGNIIEQERRRRNSVENQLEGGNAEGYLR